MKTALTRERRLHLLERVPALAGLPHAERARLACVLDETCVGPGQVVVAEGDEADRLYLVAEGRLEVSLTGPCGPMRVAILDTGEIFGEVALLTPGARRTATVRALTNGRLLSLPAPMYQTLLHAHPGPRAAFAGRAELVAMANFLKQASPFAALPPGALQALARRMERISVGEGATILRQGEVSDGCYVLRRGRLEVLAREGSGEQRQLAFLGPGTLVGETALLTAAPCNATVRALEPGDLLLLRRGDLLAAMRADRAVGGEILRLLQLRARPRRQSGAEAHQRVDATGALHTVLKDPVRGAHFRLTPEGWFLWQLLDGRHTMRDLVMDYLARFAMFAPQAIADFLAGLAAAGFLEGPALHEDAAWAAQRLAPWQRTALLARRVLIWRVALSGVDTPLGRLNRGRVRLLFTRPAQVVLALVTLLGLPAFFLVAGRASAALHAGQGGRLLLFLIPAYLLSIVLHEAGHAFTVKHFGHEVPRVGIGWYWFSPIAYVDTSDMWLAGRWARGRGRRRPVHRPDAGGSGRDRGIPERRARPYRRVLAQGWMVRLLPGGAAAALAWVLAGAVVVLGLAAAAGELRGADRVMPG